MSDTVELKKPHDTEASGEPDAKRQKVDTTGHDETLETNLSPAIAKESPKINSPAKIENE